MHIVCMDLEGVLVPEIWINVARSTGIDELKLTTRDISDYDVLMKRRIAILKEHNLKLDDIRQVIDLMEPLKGAKDFLQTLRSKIQVIILSDTFNQFAKPLMEKLSWPTLFCNTLVTEKDGTINSYILRQNDGKRHAVAALKSIGFTVIAAGDSYNDLSMITTADTGILFRPPETILKEYPYIPAVTEYSDFLLEIERHL